MTKTQLFLISGDYTHEKIALNIIFNFCYEININATHWGFMIVKRREIVVSTHFVVSFIRCRERESISFCQQKRDVHENPTEVLIDIFKHSNCSMSSLLQINKQQYLSVTRCYLLYSTVMFQWFIYYLLVIMTFVCHVIPV